MKELYLIFKSSRITSILFVSFISVVSTVVVDIAEDFDILIDLIKAFITFILLLPVSEYQSVISLFSQVLGFIQRCSVLEFSGESQE
jgi:hypothetical protein